MTEQDHFTEITEEIDKYAKTDRSFILWYLLEEYIEDAEKELGNLPVVKETKQDYAVALMCERQIKEAEEIRDILFYEIW